MKHGPIEGSVWMIVDKGKKELVRDFVHNYFRLPDGWMNFEQYSRTHAPNARTFDSEGRYPRKCEVCHQGMQEGWTDGEGFLMCSPKCLFDSYKEDGIVDYAQWAKDMTEPENDPVVYWTVWWEDEEQYREDIEIDGYTRED